MLRDLSKLEVETETKLSMKELAQKFENVAHGETLKTDALLILPVKCSEVTILEMFEIAYQLNFV